MHLSSEENSNQQLQRGTDSKIKLVADANIIFSALIKKGLTSEILFDNTLEFYSPDYLFQELKEHKNILLKKTERNRKEFSNFIFLLKNVIQVVNKEDYQDFFELAKKHCPDIDDIPYFALAIKLNRPIWSNDKRLASQNKVQIFTTKEILEKYF